MMKTDEYLAFVNELDSHGCLDKESVDLCIKGSEDLAASENCARKLAAGGKAKIKRLNCEERLVAAVIGAYYARERYAALHIPEDIFYDTFTDIRIWSENYRRDSGKPGLENLYWLKWHISLRLFRIGRLQFQFFPFFVPPFVGIKNFFRPPYRRGKECLNIHIPRGGKLDIQECQSSFAMAKEFFSKYFGKDFTLGMCFSWLLYPRNAEFMEPDSNIMRFASLFDVQGGIAAGTDAQYYMFGSRKADIRRIKPSTSLQKKAVEYYLSGGKFGIGYGIVRL